MGKIPILFNEFSPFLNGGFELPPALASLFFELPPALAGGQ